jgi:hypothetical protein
VLCRVRWLKDSGPFRHKGAIEAIHEEDAVRLARRGIVALLKWTPEGKYREMKMSEFPDTDKMMRKGRTK